MAQPSAPPPADADVEQARGAWRWVLLTVAWVSLGLGIAGVFLPVLPTVPFIILASWAGMRSSRRVHRFLELHRVFGPILRDWRAHRAVSRRAKWAATLSMSGGAAFLWWGAPSPWIAAGAVAVMASVGIWLWLRPEPQRA